MFGWLRGKGADEPASLFGKIPSQPDFVRIRATGEVVDAFDAWLQLAFDQLLQRRLSLEEHTTYFIFSHGSSRHVLVGALRASQDSVGRKFPVSAFGVAESSAVAKNLGMVPEVYGGVLDRLKDVLQLSRQLSAGELRGWLDQALCPPAEVLKEAGSRWEDLAPAVAAVPELERMMGPARDAWCYALVSLWTAIRPRVGGQPEGLGPTLDCPIKSRVDISFWLSIAAHWSRWARVPPVVLWQEDPARMLLTFGAAAPGALVFLADRAQEDDHLWPLHTSDPASLSAALSTLPPGMARILDDRTSPLSDLLASVRA
jgi:type VI secretion system ImpM family protein